MHQRGRNYNYYRRIQEYEVKEELTRMSNGKAVGRDKIPIKGWKFFEGSGIGWLTKLFNEIMTEQMLDKWKRSTLIPKLHKL